MPSNVDRGESVRLARRIADLLREGRSQEALHLCEAAERETVPALVPPPGAWRESLRLVYLVALAVGVFLVATTERRPPRSAPPSATAALVDSVVATQAPARAR